MLRSSVQPQTVSCSARSTANEAPTAQPMTPILVPARSNVHNRVTYVAAELAKAMAYKLLVIAAIKPSSIHKTSNGQVGFVSPRPEFTPTSVETALSTQWLHG